MLKYQHYCRFFIIRDTKRFHSGVQRWVEKCKCGRTVMVEIDVFIDDKTIPKMRKVWFNLNGELEKVTGSEINSTLLEINANRDAKLDDNSLPSETM